ncbi:MAG TPA: hypothetical protein VF770_00400 [Solirubrobacterales bacterium]
MRADYDSEADALSIELRRVKRFDHQEQVDDDYCNVGIAGGRAVDVELLYPARHLDLLEVAAERYGLDGTALVAAAQAALAAPDRLVELEVAARVAA